MRISAIVCTHNRRELLPRALESLRRQTLPATDYEIIVVDNGSSDGTDAVVEALLPDVPNLRYVFEARLGISAARNRGTAEACAPVVAFMDDDEQAGEGWLESLLDGFSLEPRRPLCVGGRVEPDYEAPPPRWLPGFARNALSIIDYGGAAREIDFPREWIGGGNMAMERDYLLEAGGFDGRLGRRGASLVSNEEIAVLQGIVNAGGVIRYEPAATVRHFVPASRVRLGWLCRRMYAQGVSNVLSGSGRAGGGDRRGVARELLRLRSPESLLPLLLVASYAGGVVAQTLRGRFRAG